MNFSVFNIFILFIAVIIFLGIIKTVLKKIFGVNVQDIEYNINNSGNNLITKNKDIDHVVNPAYFYLSQNKFHSDNDV